MRLRELLDSGELHPEGFCDAVYKLGPSAAPLAPDLIRIATHPDGDGQWAAADALGKIASAAPECLAELVELLRHPSPIVRNSAKEALSNLGEVATPVLKPLLKSSDKLLRNAAEEILGR